MILAVEGLHVVFGRGAHDAGAVHAVRDVSFRVAEGAAFGIVGESGSGKTTVLRAIAGLVAPTLGRIAVGGQRQGARRERAFARVCQMVFQDPYGSLHPRHTVDRVLVEPLAIHGLARGGEADRRVEQALPRSGSAPASGSGIPTSSPAASASAWRSRAPSSSSRASSCWTSRPRRSTSRCRPRS